LSQDGFGIAHNADVDRATLANFGRVDIDLEHFGIRVEPGWLPVRDDIIEPGANKQHDIGILKGHATGAEKRPRMIVWHHTAPLRGGKKWNARGLDKLLEFFTGLRPQNPATGDQQWALSPRQHLHRLFDQTGIARNAMLGFGRLRPHHTFFIHPGVEHIARQVDIGGTQSSGQSLAIGHVDVGGNTPGGNCLRRPFARRAHHAELIDLLKDFVMELANGTGAAQGNNRRRICIRMRHTGNQVRRGRPRSRRAQAGFAADTCIGVGHHGRCLFVSHVNHADAHLAAGILSPQHGTAHNEKHRVCAFVLQGARYQLIAKDFAHNSPSPSRITHRT
jgi:hypothetical protein